MQIATTQRLIIREFTLADAPFVLQMLQTPGWLQFIGDRGVRNLGDAERYIDVKFLQVYAALGFGMYAVALKESAELIGMAGLVKRDHLAHADLGFALLPEYEGRGIALEAASAVLEFARETLQLDPLLAIVMPENSRSIALLQKLGFVFEQELNDDKILLVFKK